MNVCVEGIKSGTDPSDTWSKSLQQIRMVTAAVAKSIVEVYPTIKCLYDGYRECETRQEAEQMLERIEVYLIKIGGVFFALSLSLVY